MTGRQTYRQTDRHVGNFPVRNRDSGKLGKRPDERGRSRLRRCIGVCVCGGGGDCEYAHIHIRVHVYVDACACECMGMSLSVSVSVSVLQV